MNRCKLHKQSIYAKLAAMRESRVPDRLPTAPFLWYHCVNYITFDCSILLHFIRSFVIMQAGGGIVMATTSLARPGLAAHQEALRLPFPGLVKRLTKLIGRKLTAYAAGVQDTRALDRWIDGVHPYGDKEQRLRLTFQVARTLADYDSPSTVQAWLLGVNPELGDRVPLALLREGEIEKVGAEVMAAARAFIAGG